LRADFTTTTRSACPCNPWLVENCGDVLMWAAASAGISRLDHASIRNVLLVLGESGFSVPVRYGSPLRLVVVLPTSLWGRYRDRGWFGYCTNCPHETTVVRPFSGCIRARWPAGRRLSSGMALAR